MQLCWRDGAAKVAKSGEEELWREGEMRTIVLILFCSRSLLFSWLDWRLAVMDLLRSPSKIQIGVSMAMLMILLSLLWLVPEYVRSGRERSVLREAFD